MTLDEHIARVMRTIDAAFRAQLDRNVDRMIESGVPADRVMDHADEQRDVYAAWRASTLAQIRQWLQAEITTS